MPYNRVGRCIYCGAAEHSPGRRRLGDEHIIPEALDGSLILPEASCGKCEGVTSSAEQYCAKATLGALRYQLDLPTKRPKNRPKTLPVEVRSGGVWRIENVPVEDYPLLVAMPRLSWPGILAPPDVQLETNRPRFFVTDISAEANSAKLRAQFEATNLTINVVTRFRVDKLRPMLAKIAHAFATAELGLGAFRPLLLDVINGTDEDPALYVGGVPVDEGEGDTRHELTLQFIDKAGEWFVGVRIRLFADLCFPTYYCVVGAC